MMMSKYIQSQKARSKRIFLLVCQSRWMKWSHLAETLVWSQVTLIYSEAGSVWEKGDAGIRNSTKFALQVAVTRKPSILPIAK